MIYKVRQEYIQQTPMFKEVEVEAGSEKEARRIAKDMAYSAITQGKLKGETIEGDPDVIVDPILYENWEVKEKKKLKYIVVKEILEKVVAVEEIEGYEDSDYVDMVDDARKNGEVLITSDDFKGDYSVEKCLNCEGMRASEVYEVDENLNKLVKVEG
jgi:hypothetical protein